MTQLISARQCRYTEEITAVAQAEHIDSHELIRLLSIGHIVIPHNCNRNAIPTAIGKNMSTKVNANIGTSGLDCNPAAEVDKIRVCKQLGVHSIMDLSTAGDLDRTRKIMLAETDLIFGTVPIYAVAAYLERKNKDIRSFEPDMLFDEIEKQAEQGVDFMTVHAGINKTSLAAHLRDMRILGIVSRGGSLLKRWMMNNGSENPLYEFYDRLLDICVKHDVCLSLGDGFRPGAIMDATDRTQIAELLVLGELVQRSREAGVQVMVEGPGHIPLNQIMANVLLQKRLCDNAPFYVLGPLPTDFASGYDHICGAIGGAVAAAAGADFLCYVTPAEHLCLPDKEDVKQGIMASRIAAHIADIAKGYPGAMDVDNNIAQARREMNWDKLFALSIDPELARRRKTETSSETPDQCSMCGNLCAIRTNTLNDYKKS